MVRFLSSNDCPKASRSARAEGAAAAAEDDADVVAADAELVAVDKVIHVEIDEHTTGKTDASVYKRLDVSCCFLIFYYCLSNLFIFT